MTLRDVLGYDTVPFNQHQFLLLLSKSKSGNVFNVTNATCPIISPEKISFDFSSLLGLK
jgi:hypothetical protein